MMFGPSLSHPRAQMTSKILAASLMFAAVAASAAAQSDKIHLLNGSTVANVRVTDWDIRSLRYQKGGNTESVQSDQVAKVELASFKTTYARGMRDPGLMLTLAKEQLGEKNMVLAQLGFVGASAQFFDEGQAAEAVSALDDLQKSIPEAGVLPEVFRQKFEYYMGLGGKGQSSAAATTASPASHPSAASRGESWSKCAVSPVSKSTLVHP